MRTFAHEQQQAQRTESDNSTAHRRGFSSHSYKPTVSVRHLQRTVGNQAIQRLLKTDRTPLLVHDALASPGQPLDSADIAYFGSRFGQDFSNVRIHKDDRAAMSTRAVDATAYTVGQHIVFDDGAYSPRSADGRRLLAHELAHVVQQSGDDQSAGRPRLSPGDAEVAADRAADTVLSSKSVESSGAVAAGTLQRQAQPITPQRIEELNQLARNPQNFATGRKNDWQRLTAAERGAVMRAMDQLYGVPFTTEFVRFADAGQLVAGGINFSRGGVLGEAIFERTDPNLWRTPRFPPMFPGCLSLVYPNGSEFARCAPAPPPPTAAQVIRSAVAQARGLQAAGNLQQAMTVLQRARPDVERLEREAAHAAGLDPSVTDPDAVIDFFARRSMMFVPVPLPPEVVDWRNVHNEVKEGRTGPMTDDELLEEILQDEPPPEP